MNDESWMFFVEIVAPFTSRLSRPAQGHMLQLSNYTVHHTDNNKNITIIFSLSIVAVLWWLIALHPLLSPLFLHTTFINPFPTVPLQSILSIQSKLILCKIFKLFLVTCSLFCVFYLVCFHCVLKTIHFFNPKTCLKGHNSKNLTGTPVNPSAPPLPRSVSASRKSYSMVQ